MTNAYAGMLKGKIAVVTGASEGGIGHACAVALLEAGARVVPVARNLDSLMATFNGYGDAAIPMAADLIVQEDRMALVDRILAKTGKPIDLFHANAGAYIGGQLVDNDPIKLQNVVTLNTLGMMVPVQAVLSHMYKRKLNKSKVCDVVLTGSIAGDGYNPYHEEAYGPSKLFGEQMFKLLRPAAITHRVRASVISPGPTDTPLTNEWDPVRLAKARKKKMFIAPEDVANALMFIVTQEPHVCYPRVVVTPRFNVPVNPRVASL